VLATPAIKARVERAVPNVRDDGIAGETLHTIADARTRTAVVSARAWLAASHTHAATAAGMLLSPIGIKEPGMIGVMEPFFR
jgi:hypothetical protein